MRRLCLMLVATAVITGVAAPHAWAILPFQKVFWAEYVDNHSDAEFAEYVKKDAKCWCCHQGKKRTNRNAFGAELSKLLDKKEHAKDPAAVAAALKKVCAMKVDPNDPNSETFGERIAAGKLPAGELEDLKKEPAEASAE